MLKPILDLFREKYPFGEIDGGDFSSFKVNGMTFETAAYSVEGVGQASLMSAKGMAGLMKMSTLIINPTKVDAPLFSVDLIKAMGNNILIAELYDTCLDFRADEEPFLRIGEKYADLKDMETEKRWYDGIRYKSSVAKKVSGKEAARLMPLTEEFAKAYLELLEKAAPCDPRAKLEKARAYSHGLIKNGGTSTDSFLKAWGKEKTQEFFDRVLFG